MLAETLPRSAADDLARECIYRFLAAVVGGPYSDWDRAVNLNDQELAIDAADSLGSRCDDFRRLADDLRAPREALRAQFDRVFGLVVPRECPPYETEFYPTEDTFGRSQQMADVAGFYGAFGIEPSLSSPERPDHLALELEFMAFLLTKKRLAMADEAAGPALEERIDLCNRAARDFFRDHLAWWVPSFAAGLRRKAEEGYLRDLANILAAWVPEECRRLHIPEVLRPVRPWLIEQLDDQSGCAACPLLA
jgi:TorA maturation chaperone TorD